jgi:hypothetical protein
MEGFIRSGNGLNLNSNQVSSVMQGVLSWMMARNPAERFDAAMLSHTLQDDMTNLATLNPVDGTIMANPTVALGNTVNGVGAPSEVAATSADVQKTNASTIETSGVQHHLFQTDCRNKFRGLQGKVCRKKSFFYGFELAP